MWFLKRLLFVIPTLLGVSLVSFILMVNVPGDPVLAIVGERADPIVIKKYQEELGVNQNFFGRYIGYLKMLSKGDLGNSYHSGQSVSSEIKQKIPNTMMLAFVAMLMATMSGVFFGFLAVLYKDSFFDKFCVFISTLLISLPVFWFGLLLIYLFAVYLIWLPAGGMDSPLSIILPAFTLGSRSGSYIFRITRTSMFQALREEFIITVRAKGGSVYRELLHAFRFSLIPIVTFIGLDFGSYLNGSVLTESIFAWDGLGRYAVMGIFKRDYPVIMGCVLTGATIFMFMNLFIDVLARFINPKIKTEIAA